MRLLTAYPRPAALPRWWGIDTVVAPVVIPGATGLTEPSQWFAARSSLNLLDPDLEPPEWPPPGYAGCTRLIADSGHLAAGSDAQGSFANWGPRARAALDAACAGLEGALAGAGLTLYLRPRAGDVLSDVPSCLGFLRSNSQGHFGLVLEPGALLAESMLPRAQEHLDRAVGALLDQPSLGALIVTNVERTQDGRLTAAPLHRGLLEPGLLIEIAGRAHAAGSPVVLHSSDLPAQLRALGITPPEP